MTPTGTDIPPGFRLPPHAYRDPAWLAVERERLLDRCWTLVADAAALDEVGARVAVQIGDQPIVVARGERGLVAFHDVCRHRGMTFCEAGAPPVRASTLRCPYHGWEWDLDGSLVRVPQRRTQFPGLDAGALGLHPASVDVWEGMVFAHPEPDAPSLAATLGDLPTWIGSVRPGRLVEVARQRIEVELNWKLFVENHIDVYHLWYLHDRSLAGFDHARFEHRAVGPHWASYEPARASGPESPAADSGLGTGAPTIRHLDERDRRGLSAHLVFPNLPIASSPELFATYAVHPVTATRSWIDLRIRAEAGADGVPLLAAARSFIDEDVRACEQVQRGLGSRAFAVGPLARDHERPIARFHDHLLETLGHDLPGERP